jgi:hypothetical protein
MKTKTGWSFSCATITLVAVYLLVSATAFILPPEAVPWAEVISKGGVTVSFISKGGSSGACVDAEFVNPGRNPVKLSIKPGTAILQNEDPDMQRLLVVTDEVIALAPGQRKSVTLEAYCIDPGNYTPPNRAVFAFNPKVTSSLAEVAQLGKAHRADPDAMQAAIWAMASDQFPVAGITSANRRAQDELRTYIAGQRNEPVPWHDVNCGNILNQPWNNEILEVKGKLVYDVLRPVRGKLVLLGPDGEVVLKFFENQMLEQAQHTQTFWLRGSDIARGDYRFVLFVNGEVYKEKVIRV